jgi:molybdopterin converting factor small subunit
MPRRYGRRTLTQSSQLIVPRVRFTNHLRRFFPSLDEVTVDGATVADVVAAVETLYPGLADYIVDEQGSLRKHVNIFVGDALVRDRRALSDTVSGDDEIFILQALSGG